ncbi:MAG: NAD(P)-dependent oxidoreductase [Clostridia bacterium]|nr:NAD(P)-dependent oxidoreductase [Clostridia bacterium]
MNLIVGTGFAGSYVYRALKKAGKEDVLATVRDPGMIPAGSGADFTVCDVTDPRDIASLAARCSGRPLTVFYFAACHNVDYLYTHPDEGRAVNLSALEAFLDAFNGAEKLFFASTDCVYGENAPLSPKFRETDATRPINEYGRQKKEAEQIVRDCGFTAVRFSYMLGPSLLPKKHFYDTIAGKLMQGEPVELLDGMVRSALSYGTAAALLIKLSELPPEKTGGTVNLCSDGEYTKYELGRMIAARIGADGALVRPLPESEGSRFFTERRASRLVMDNTKLKTLLDIKEILPGV